MILNDDCLTRLLMLSPVIERGETGLSEYAGREGNSDGEERDVAVGRDNDNRAESGRADEKAVGVEKESRVDGLEIAALIRLEALLMG